MRRPFQFHLSTFVVFILTLGGLLGANIRHGGWPIQYPPQTTSAGTTVSPPRVTVTATKVHAEITVSSINTQSCPPIWILVVDVLVGALILAGPATLVESFMRRRG